MIKKRYWLGLFFLVSICLVWASQPNDNNPEWTITNLKDNSLGVINNLLVGEEDIVIGCEKEIVYIEEAVEYKGDLLENNSYAVTRKIEQVPHEVCKQDSYYGIIKDEKISFNKNKIVCSIKDNCLICDDAIGGDGNGDGICQDGESCIKKCIVLGLLKTYHKNSEQEWDTNLRSYKKIIEVDNAKQI